MFENHKPHRHKTAAALFFQSKKIFLPRLVVSPDVQTTRAGRHCEVGAWRRGATSERGLWFLDSCGM